MAIAHYVLPSPGVHRVHVLQACISLIPLFRSISSLGDEVPHCIHTVSVCWVFLKVAPELRRTKCKAED